MNPWLCLLALNFGHSPSQGQDIRPLGLDMQTPEVSSEEAPNTQKWSPHVANYEDRSPPEKVAGNEKLEETRNPKPNEETANTNVENNNIIHNHNPINPNIIPTNNPINNPNTNNNNEIQSNNNKNDNNKAPEETTTTEEPPPLSCPLPDYFCNPTAGDHLGKSSAATVKLCEEACMAEAQCNFFTFFRFRGIPSCYILKSCNEKKPACNDPRNCKSGQRTCKKKFCAKLVMNDGRYAHWRCQGLNPYMEDIPEGKTCHTSCSSWRTTAGLPFTAMSTCQPDGSWSSPVHFPRGNLERPHVLETPDMGDMPCAPAPIPTASCKPLNITYDPNEEDGAGFFCTPPLDWSNLPVKMSKPTVCYLLCNMMLVATVQCKEGVWTGHPEIGFWCNQNNAPIGYWEEPKKTESIG